MGRKISIFTPELFETVLARVSTGETLRALARELNFDEGSYRWHIANDEQLATRYATARQMQAESWADQIVELSDKQVMGKKTKTNSDGSVETTTGDCIDRSRLKVDTRKWLMAKLHPKVYSEKIKQEVTGAEGGPIVFKWEQ